MASESQIPEKNRVWMRANLAQEYFVGGYQHGSGFSGGEAKISIPTPGNVFGRPPEKRWATRSIRIL